MRNLHIANLFHSLLTAFLLLQQFSFATYVTAIALGQHIFTDLFDRFACNDFRTDSSLNRNVELLSWNQFLQLFTHPATKGDGIVLMRQCRECVDRLTVEQDVELDEFRSPNGSMKCSSTRFPLTYCWSISSPRLSRHSVMMGPI